MPQSVHDRTAELHNIPEHTAEAAATNHGKGTHLTAHEETVQAEDHSQNSAVASKLHHGKAAALDAAKSKWRKQNAVDPSAPVDSSSKLSSVTSRGPSLLSFGLAALGIGLVFVARAGTR